MGHTLLCRVHCQPDLDPDACLKARSWHTLVCLAVLGWSFSIYLPTRPYVMHTRLGSIFLARS